MERTSLYRFFSADDELLYIGITLNPFARLGQHSLCKPIHEVCHIELEWFDDRQTALDAEAVAIARERPKWNVAGQREARALRKTPIRPKRQSPKTKEKPSAAERWAVGITRSVPEKPVVPMDRVGPPKPYYRVAICRPDDVPVGVKFDRVWRASDLDGALKMIRTGDLVWVGEGVSLPPGFWAKVFERQAYKVDDARTLMGLLNDADPKAPPIRSPETVRRWRRDGAPGLVIADDKLDDGGVRDG